MEKELACLHEDMLYMSKALCDVIDEAILKNFNLGSWGELSKSLSTLELKLWVLQTYADDFCTTEEDNADHN